MNKFRREIMWVALVLIVVLTALAIYGAFIGADRAQMFFNSTPTVVFWVLFAITLIAGLIAFRRLIRVPGLLLMHVGCILVLIGGALGSAKGYKATGNDRIAKGQMVIYEGQTTDQVRVDTNTFVFSLGTEFEHSFHSAAISEQLRKEFEKAQNPLSSSAVIRAHQGQSMWFVSDELKEYSVKKEDNRLNVYLTAQMRQLPFAIKLCDFRIEYYNSLPPYLQIEIAGGQAKRIPAEVGQEVDLGGTHGTARITRKFERFRMSLEDGKQTPFDDPQGNPMPALEVQITPPEGEATRHYAFALMPGFGHSQTGPKLTYSMPTGGAISDYISELEVTDKGGKVLAKKDIEVNHPLQYGGYRFYQSSYDAQAGRYTVLQVVSDTGVMIVFAGYWGICIGAIWHMWLRHLLKSIGGKK